MFSLLFTLALLCQLGAPSMSRAPRVDGPADALPTIPSELHEVVVYPQYAIVRRIAEIPPGGGVVAVTGLPPSVDSSTLRMRLTGGEVVRAEPRTRRKRLRVAPQRVLELRTELADVLREHSVARAERADLNRIELHLSGLLDEAEKFRPRVPAEQTPRPIAEVWSENLDFLRGRLEENRRRRLEVDWRSEELDERREALQEGLAASRPTEEEAVYELVVDTWALDRGPMTLEIEYGVQGAGWQPTYDLRVAQDLSGAELVYRARVWQNSGELWKGAAIVLSTMPAARVAKGPEPAPRIVRLHGPDVDLPSHPAPIPTQGLTAGHGPLDGSPGSVGSGDADGNPSGPAFAKVRVEGRSVRFHLPRQEVIVSRAAPTHVLVGRATLEVEAEHYCAPAVDPTAWLRARVRNTSDWVMLPSTATVTFGRDFVGKQALGTIRVGEQLLLNLGADPGVVVSRVRAARDVQRAGLLGNRDAVTERWLLRVENRAGRSSRPDGLVRVLLRDTLPQPGDERIRVEVIDVKPAASEDPPWIDDRLQQGILTWSFPVPAEKERTASYRTRVSFPTGWQVDLD